MGNNGAIEVIRIARTMAVGERLYREGKSERAFARLAEAVRLEDQLAYDEPPGWMQPVRHALGALLSADARYDQAITVYRADLQRHPDNAWSLLGLHDALVGHGDIEAAKAVAPKVQAAWANADVSPTASCYCHPDARTSEASP